jgi:hypothetical protein
MSAQSQGYYSYFIPLNTLSWAYWTTTHVSHAGPSALASPDTDWTFGIASRSMVDTGLGTTYEGLRRWLSRGVSVVDIFPDILSEITKGKGRFMGQ